MVHWGVPVAEQPRRSGRAVVAEVEASRACDSGPVLWGAIVKGPFLTGQCVLRWRFSSCGVWDEGSVGCNYDL